MENEAPKLDPYSKILLATQTINFLASNINSVMNDYAWLSTVNEPASAERLRNSAKQKKDLLEDALIGLVSVMESLADYCNDFDSITPIDIKIVKPAFDVLVHGEDLVEEA